MEDFYFQLFKEAYLRYFLLPMDTQIVLSAMREFGGYNLLIPNLITGAGIMLALLSSFWIGMGLAMLRPKIFSRAMLDAKYEQIGVYVRKYGWLLLPFAGLPFGTIVPAALGFFWKPIS